MAMQQECLRTKDYWEKISQKLSTFRIQTTATRKNIQNTKNSKIKYKCFGLICVKTFSLVYFCSINPVTGCYEGPKPDPLAGMTEEQKEYEALKLVGLVDQLTR